MRKKNVTDEIIHNDIGEEIHVMNGEQGEVRIKKLSMSDFLYSGEQYCPDCHLKMNHKDGYFECGRCKHSITDDEAEDGEGCPTLKSTYENDYGEYYGNDTPSDIPEGCASCGGPYPDCKTSCKIFDN